MFRCVGASIVRPVAIRLEAATMRSRSRCARGLTLIMASLIISCIQYVSKNHFKNKSTQRLKSASPRVEVGSELERTWYEGPEATFLVAAAPSVFFGGILIDMEVDCSLE